MAHELVRSDLGNPVASVQLCLADLCLLTRLLRSEPPGFIRDRLGLSLDSATTDLTDAIRDDVCLPSRRGL